jgi:hypothetical protein
MARPLWGNGASIWLAAAISAVGILAFVIWWGERQRAQQQADLQAQADVQAKQLKEAEERLEKAKNGVIEQGRIGEQMKEQLLQVREAAAQSRLQLLGLAYRSASEKLGRPPKAPDELAPFLKVADAFISPRDGQPFEVAWGTSLTAPGQLLAWEQTSLADGGRIVLITVAQPKRVTADEFKQLSGSAKPNAAPDTGRR